MRDRLSTWGIVLVLGTLILSGCGPTTAQPSPAASDDFLFLEIYIVPTKEETPGCRPLAASFLDFPAYCFDESSKSLYTYMAPDPYDIKFDASLKAIVGEVTLGRKSGACSHLEPVHSLPWHGRGCSVDLSEIGKVQVTEMAASGLLVIRFDNSSIRLSPGDDWSKQVGPCGERIYVVNHGFLDKKTNGETLRTFLHSCNYGSYTAKIYENLEHHRD